VLDLDPAYPGIPERSLMGNGKHVVPCFQVGEVGGLSPRDEGIGMHGSCIDPERAGIYIGILQCLGLHQEQGRRSVPDKDPLPI